MRNAGISPVAEQSAVEPPKQPAAVARCRPGAPTRRRDLYLYSVVGGVQAVDVMLPADEVLRVRIAENDAVVVRFVKKAGAKIEIY